MQSSDRSERLVVLILFLFLLAAGAGLGMLIHKIVHLFQ